MPASAAGPARLVDTHCHLDAGQFRGAYATIISRARAALVDRIVTIGTGLASSQAAVSIAEREDGVWAAVGADPNGLAGFGPASLDTFTELGRRESVVAIGEIGLDYHWQREPAAAQQEAFRAQLDLADRLDLPVVIHNRDADGDIEEMLLTWSSGRPAEPPLGVMHCFSGDLRLARRLTQAGFLISLSGAVTFKNAARAHEVAAGVPLDALVLETDAPYLSPHPRRGERNEPARLPLIAERVAQLRNLTPAELARATSANAARLFRWNGQ